MHQILHTLVTIPPDYKYQASNGPQFGKQQLLHPCALDQSSHTIGRLHEAIPLKLLWSMVEVSFLSIAKRNVDALSKLHNQIAALLQVLFCQSINAEGPFR